MSLRETSTTYYLIVRLTELILSAMYFALRSCLAGLSWIIRLEQKNKLVVLTYHHVSDAQKTSFTRQMDQLLAAGQAVFADSSSSDSTGRRRIAVTFDDGYQSVLRNAMPVLVERNIPFIIFMATKYMGEKPGWMSDKKHPYSEERLISGDQLRSLQEGMVKIGSHTHSHAYLGDADRETLVKELTLSKTTLEGLLFREVNLLSLPYGSMDRDTLRYSRMAGYKTLFLNVPYPETMDEDVCLIGRTHVSLDDWGIELFLKLRGAYDWISITYGAKKKIKMLSPSLCR